MLKFEAIVGKVSKGIAQASMWAIFGITFVLITDIILRFVTESSALMGTYEMTEMAMIVIIYMGLSVTQLDKDHIRVVMLIEKFPWRVRTFIEAAVFAFTAYLCYMLFYAALLQTQAVIRSGLTTQVLYIPHWPFFMIMFTGLAVLAVVFTLDTVKSVLAGIKNEKPEGMREKTEAEKVIEATKDAI